MNNQELKISEDHSIAIQSIAMDVQVEYLRIRKLINGMGFQLQQYRRQFRRLEDLSDLVTEDNKEYKFIKETLDEYKPDELIGLDEEDLETINRISMYVGLEYDKSKHEGREIVGVFRKLITAGQFPHNYLAEFDRRF